jgi:hypothetical protein
LTTHQNAPTSAAAKQGAAIGGWVCFGLGALIMYVSVWTFILYLPLFFVAFVLSIVAMAQRRIVLGVILLLATILVPLIEWVALATIRTNKFLDDHGVPKVNAFNRPEPSIVPSQANRTLSPAERSARQEQPQLRPDEASQAAIERVYKETISGHDAHDIEIKYHTVADSLASFRPHPVFSPDGRFVIYGRDEGGRIVVVLKRLDTLETVQTIKTSREPVNVALSPDGQSLFYLVADGQMNIKRLPSGEDIQLPARAPGNQFFEEIDWLKKDQILFARRFLMSLDNLQYTELRDQADTRTSAAPRCKIIFNSIGGDNWGLHIFNDDESYGHLLLSCNLNEGDWSVSKDMRHIAIMEQQGQRRNLHLYYLGVQPSSQPRFVVRRSEVTLMSDERLNLAPNQRSGPWRAFGAQVNPLNQKIVGINYHDYRGNVIVTGAAGDEMPVTITYTKDQLSPGNAVELAGTGQIWAPLRRSDATSETTPKSRQSPKASTTPAAAHQSTDDPQNSNQTPAPQTSNSLVLFPGEHFPETRLRRLNPDEIQSWADAKLRYAINEIFARRGGYFKDATIAKWFTQFPWYHPDPTRSLDKIEESFSDVERENLKLLGRFREAKRTAPNRR